MSYRRATLPAAEALEFIAPGSVAMWVTVVITSLIVGLSALQGLRIGASWQWQLALMQAIAMLIVPFDIISSLSVSRRVLMHRIAPSKAMESETRRAGHRLLAAWAVTSLSALIVSLRLAQQNTIDWSTIAAGPGLFAIVLAAGTVGVAAWHGMVPKAALLVQPVMVGLLMKLGSPQAWKTFLSLGPMMHLAMVLSLPATVWCMYRRSSAPFRLRAATDQRSPYEWVVWRLATWRARWHRLDENNKGFVQLSSGVSVWVILLNGNSSLLNSLFSDIGATYAGWILWLTLFACGSLCIFDFNWRTLLAPSGRFRGHLGTRIAIHTASHMAMSALLIVCSLLILQAVGWSPVASALDLIAPIKAVAWPVAVDLALAIAMATWLRGHVVVTGWYVVAMVGALLCSGAVLILLGPLATKPLWHRGWQHDLGMLLLTVFCLWRANRAWARADLAELFRRNAGLETK